ncbi:hypothetical protein ACO0RG_002920 [Hanseniaspora osmophila]|uniref:N-terminal acetyltransferase A complex subunit NAT5 n=1 Tax=Hanseniaspora osmophila TaxID=56408 RepID=A0A1E5R7Q7_9ASCO|nr:N-terminal acetyltransferase A complex subunit NAT5 [Hanseniaspora osmophila]
MSLVEVTETNVYNAFMISQQCLPVAFPLKFFQESLKNINEHDSSIYFSKLVLDPKIGYPVGCFKAKMLFKNSTSAVPDGLYIEVIAVCANYQNKNYGTLMLESIEDVCKDNYLRKITVHVSIDNIKSLEWYKKHGFQQTGKALPNYYTFKNGSKMDALVLTKHLS